MLLKLFKSNQPYTIFLIPILGVILWIPSLFSTHPNIDLNSTSFAFSWLYNLLSFSPIAPPIFALLLLIAESFLLIRLNFNFIFIEHKTYLPSIMFLVFSSVIVSLQTLHPLLIGNLFLLLAISKAFVIDKKRDALKRYFESGFFLGLGAIFYPNMYVFIFVIWLTLIILRTFNLREWFVSIVGLVTPFVFYLAIMFLTDGNEELFLKSKTIIFSATQVEPLSIYSIFIFIFLGFITFISIVRGVAIVRIKKINSRKYFNLFFWFFLYICILFFIHPSLGYELIVPIAIPLSIIYSVFFTEFRSKIIGEIVFSLTIISIFAIIWLN